MDKAERAGRMDKELHRTFDDDSGNKMIYMMARERNEDNKDVKAGTVIKDKKE